MVSNWILTDGHASQGAPTKKSYVKVPIRDAYRKCIGAMEWSIVETAPTKPSVHLDYASRVSSNVIRIKRASRRRKSATVQKTAMMARMRRIVDVCRLYPGCNQGSDKCTDIKFSARLLRFSHLAWRKAT